MDKKKKVGISDNEEMMIWCAYRYAIGRHTYVNDLSDYIAETYYDKLDDETLEKLSEDIRRTICDNLSFGSPSLRYEGSVPYDRRLGIPDLMGFMNANEFARNDLSKIEEIDVYCEDYKDNSPKLYSYKQSTPIREHYSTILNSIDDLLCWDRLASYFDKKNYKLVHINNKGKKSTEVCFEGWFVTLPYKSSGIYHNGDYKWDKRYVPVKDFNNGYIIPDLIENIEDYKKEDND